MRTLNVGFRTESFGPFSYLFEQIARKTYDFDLRPVAKFGSGEAAEDSILGGELDFVLGNHYSPLAAKAKGINLCWLAIPMYDHDYKLVTRREIENPEELVGRKVSLPGREARPGCPALNLMLVLREMGLEGKVEPRFHEERGDRGDPGFGALTSGLVDAVFVEAPLDLVAERQGFRVFDAPSVEVFAGPCITTTPDFARRDPEQTKDLLRAYLETIHAFKTRKDDVLELLFESTMPFDVRDEELATRWHEARAARMQQRPIPSPASLAGTQAKASLVYPEAAGVNPLRVLDLEFVQALDEEGFIDKLSTA
jgi:ABC-type nitrate/sulfonate/bicarbonate transport system substrate-binding protein